MLTCAVLWRRIHKSQGLSIEAVRMDLSRCAGTAGQAYVALSRAASIEGLQLLRPINPRSIKTDPVVSAFYAALRSGDKEAWLERSKKWEDYPVGLWVKDSPGLLHEGRRR